MGQLPIKCNFDNGLQRCGLNIDDAKNAMVAWRLKTGVELFRNVVVINGDNTTGMGRSIYTHIFSILYTNILHNYISIAKHIPISITLTPSINRY